MNSSPYKVKVLDWRELRVFGLSRVKGQTQNKDTTMLSYLKIYDASILPYRKYTAANYCACVVVALTCNANKKNPNKQERGKKYSFFFVYRKSEQDL